MSRDTKFLAIAGAGAGTTAGIAFEEPVSWIALGFFVLGTAVGKISSYLREG